MFSWLWEHTSTLLLIPLSLVLLVYSVLIGTSAIYALKHDGTPTFVHLQKEKGQQASRLTIYFGGMQLDSKQQSSPLHETWLRYGDVLIVKYDPHNTSRRTVKATYKEAHRLGYREVVLVGISMGGRLDTDFEDYAINHNDGELKVVAVVVGDPPMTSADIMGFNRWMGLTAALLLPRSPILNPIFAPMIRSNTNPPSFDQIEPGVDHEAIAKHWEVSYNYPFTGWLSQIRKVFLRLGIAPGTYDAEIFVLRSQRDDVVSRSADLRWLVAYGREDQYWRIIEVISPYSHITTLHSAIREHPEAWQSAMSKVYEQIPQAA